MKNTFLRLVFTVFATCSLLLTSCQNESVSTPEEQQSSQTPENLTTYFRMVANDTAANGTDESQDMTVDWDTVNCEVIEMTVMFNGVNGTYVSDGIAGLDYVYSQVSSETGVQVGPNDMEVISITVGQGGQTIVLTDSWDIYDYLEDCDYNDMYDEEDANDTGDDQIECVDVVYPITMLVYSSETQETSVVVINNDDELYDALANLTIIDTISFEYPMTFTTGNNSTVTVNNVDDLFDVLENAYLECGVDNDQDDNDNDQDDGNNDQDDNGQNDNDNDQNDGNNDQDDNGQNDNDGNDGRNGN